MSRSAYVPAALLVYLAVTSLLRASAASAARRRGGALIFGPMPVVRVLLLLIIVGFALASLYVVVVPPSSITGAIIFGAISLAGTLAFPAEIVASPNGLEQIKWWGSRVSMLWSEVRQVDYHKGPATTIVTDRGGHHIVHAGFNRDGDGFRRYCKEHSHLHIEDHAM